MHLPQSGGCQCGAVRYEISATPRVVYACHCTECQRQSGSAFGMGLVVNEAQFRLARGTPRRFDHVTESGRRAEAWFCSNCGTRVFGSPREGASGEGAMRIVRAGTLDDISWLRPSIHVWTRSAQPWTVIPGDVPRFETRPPVPVWLVSGDAEPVSASNPVVISSGLP
jgi:hypothetical protein